MPVTFEEFQGKGVLGFSSSSSSSTSPDSFSQLLPPSQQQKWQNWCYVGITEPTSVLDSRRSPSPPTSSSTLSSSQGGCNGGGGGGSTETTTTGITAAAISGNPCTLDLSREKCGQVQVGMDEWEGVLPGSPSQEQSILRLIMCDVEDPSLGLNKLLQGGNGGGSQQEEMEFNAGFGVVDQGFGLEPITNLVNTNSIDPSVHATSSEFPLVSHNARIGSMLNPSPNTNPVMSTSAANLFPGMFQLHQQPPPPPIEAVEEKPQLIINQNQVHFGQNLAMCLPLPYAQLQEHHLLSPPPTKRLNSGPTGANYQANLRPELLLQRQQPHMLQQQRPAAAMMKQKIVMTDELAAQQAILNPICQAAELIENGNPILAQGILARLNHQLSLSIGKPHLRAAFYFKEALQLLLLHINNNTNPSNSVSACSLIMKIGAYKSFSEISPILQFANFTCNQALLEACEGFDRIHVVDFDIGFGGQWASLMQELALKNGAVPSLKITAFATPSSHDEIEIGFTQENLRIFASEISMSFDIEVLGFESLNSCSWPMPVCGSDKEAIAVNLPIGPFCNHPSLLPVALRFVKRLSPKIVVALDRGCDRTDLPFANLVNHSIQSYSSLLESLEAVNLNLDALQRIERFLVQPSIEKIVLGRHRHSDRTPPWRSLFLQSGFIPLQFSNFSESQAECLVQRTPVRGFHVEKSQSSLVLCWQRKELISASAWRC